MSLFKKFFIKLRWATLSLISTLISRYKINSEFSSIKISISNVHELQRGLTFFSKEPDTLEWIESMMDSEITLLDIGANIGIYSLYFAALSPGGKVISLEPDASSFVSLVKNIPINNLKNISPRLVAASNQNTFINLDLSEYEPGAGAGSIDGPYMFTNKKSIPIKQPVMAVKLDNFLENEETLKKPFAIKIDVDGHESSILEGAEYTLRNPNLKTLIIELNTKSNEELDQIITNLSESGLELIGRGCWEQKWEEYTVANYLFARDDFIKKMLSLKTFSK
jgi:FkbM family methyltransferase